MAEESSAFPLLDLPAEIRNCIFELSFTPDWPADDLFKACPPSNALITTCRQVYQEARGLYRTGYRAYWTTTQFSVTMEKDQQKLEAMVSLLRGETTSTQIKEYGFADELRSEDVRHIASLFLKSALTPDHYPDDKFLHYVHRDGLWWGLDHGSNRGYRDGHIFLPVHRTEAVERLGYPIRIGEPAYVPSYRIVTTRDLDHVMNDAQIEKVKLAAGKNGLTRQEIVAKMTWNAMGSIDA